MKARPGILRAEMSGGSRANPQLGFAFRVSVVAAVPSSFAFAPHPPSFMDLPYEKATVGTLDRPALLALVEPVLRAHGCSLVEVVFKTERPGWILRVAIEREGSSSPGGGVTVDLCAQVSRDISAVLDESELIPHAYQLEVASPGVERALRTTEELARFVGQLVKVHLLAPAEDGQRVLRGPLVSVAEASFVLNVDGKDVTCVVPNVKQANLQLEFGSAHKKTGSSSGAGAAAKGAKKPKPPHPKAADRSSQGTDATSPRETNGDTQDRGIPAGTE